MPTYGSVNDWLSSDKLGLQDFSNNGECSNCGQCCSNFLPMTDSEIEIIKEYIHRNHIKEQRLLAPTVTRTVNMTCPFRSDLEKKCLIYPVRPTICKLFMCYHKKEDVYKRRDEISIHCKSVDCRHTFYGRPNTIDLLIWGMLNEK